MIRGWFSRAHFHVYLGWYNLSYFVFTFMNRMVLPRRSINISVSSIWLCFITFPYLMSIGMRLSLQAPTSSLYYLHQCWKISPYLRSFFSKKLDYSFFRVFRCLCFPCVMLYNSRKLVPNSIPCIFLRYTPCHKWYKCLTIKGKFYISRDVIFYE